MDVVFLRHGATKSNQEKRYVGITDEPLSPAGAAFAASTGILPDVQTVYVSPMRRAVETAHIKFPNAECIICADLREMDFGDFEGRTADEMAQDADYRRWVDSGCTARCPNGEQLDEFSNRTCRAFDTIVHEAIEHGASRLVIAAHGGTLMAILSRYAEPQRPYFDWRVPPACGYQALLDAGNWHKAPRLMRTEFFETLLPNHFIGDQNV
ncbi:histidine phosphatase family protein [Oscillospiraceae bacterium WX1]